MCQRDYTINDFHETSEGERRGNASFKFLVVEMNKQFLGKNHHLLIGIPSTVWSLYQCFLGRYFLYSK